MSYHSKHIKNSTLCLKKKKIGPLVFSHISHWAVGACSSGALRGAEKLPTFLHGYGLIFRMETVLRVVTAHFYPLKYIFEKECGLV